MDLVYEALRQRQKMGIANATADRSFLAGSCGRLPSRSHSFDLVIGVGIWHHLQEDLGTPYSEVARVLKNDGFLSFKSRLLEVVF